MIEQQTRKLSDIKVGERMRKDLGDVTGLAESIKDLGIMQPIGIDKEDNLVFGGRRYAAATLLKMEHVPVVHTDTQGSMTRLRMMELEENYQRKEMTWKERVNSVAEIHRLHKIEAHLNGQRWADRHTAELLNISHATSNYCVRISELLKDPKHPIQEADSLTSAFKILLQLKEDEANRLQAMMTLPQAPVVTTSSPEVMEIIGSLPDPMEGVDSLVNDILSETETVPYESEKCVACSGTAKNSRGDVCPICKGTGFGAKLDTIKVPLSQMFHMGDSLEWCAARASDSIDHICTDPPYGIEMSMLSQDVAGMNDIDRVEDEHDVDENLDLLENFLPISYRILKPGGFCVLWCDSMHFRMLHDMGLEIGYRVQRWPLHWCKTGPAKNGSAQYNFTKKTEVAIVMRKNSEEGDKKVIAMLTSQQPENYFNCGPADKSMFPHPFAKPVPLWQWVMRAIATPGQIILDPFAGSGSGTYAAASLGFRPYGIEKKEVHFMNLINIMSKGYREWMQPKKVEFT